MFIATTPVEQDYTRYSKDACKFIPIIYFANDKVGINSFAYIKEKVNKGCYVLLDYVPIHAK